MKKKRTDFDPEIIQRLRLKSMKFARTNGYGDHQEDFASYCCLRLVENTYTRQDWVFTDYLRINFGDIRAKNGKSKIHHNLISIEKCKTSYKLEQKWNDLIKGLKLDTLERVLFLLVYEYGFSQDECSYLIGLSPGFVSQKLSYIYSIFKKT